MIELYNEEINDLLEPSRKNLKIKESPEGFYVKDLSSTVVHNKDDLMRLLDIGKGSRKVASTNMNSESSRSHCIFSITVESSYLDSVGETKVKAGKLNMVDLAGSEK